MKRRGGAVINWEGRGEERKERREGLREEGNGGRDQGGGREEGREDEGRKRDQRRIGKRDRKEIEAAQNGTVTKSPQGESSMAHS